MPAAGPDAARLHDFYSKTCGWTIGPDNIIDKASTGGLDGTLRQDPADTVI